MTRTAAVMIALALAALLALALLVAPRVLIAPTPAWNEAHSSVESVVRVSMITGGAKVRRKFRQIGTPEWRLELPDVGVQSIPLSLAADESRLFLANAAGSIVAVDQSTRRVVWTRSIGELRVTPRQIVSMDSGSILLLPGAGEALLRLRTSDGAVLARWPPPSPALFQSACFFGGRVILLSAVDTGQSLLLMDSAGVLNGRAPLPWPELQRAHPLQRQLAATYDPKTGRCVLALMAGHGFAIVDSNQRVSTRSYAEHAAIGSVAVRTTGVGRGKIVTESRLLGDAAPISEVSAGNGVLYVPFAGPTIRDTAIIDLFLLPTGAYWLTLTVPHPVRRIAIARRRVFVASYQRGVPVVVGYAVQELR